MSSFGQKLVASLLLKLLSEGDLQRFVRAHFGEKMMSDLGSKSKGPQFYFDLVKYLSDRALLNLDFFDALEKWFPYLSRGLPAALLDQARRQILKEARAATAVVKKAAKAPAKKAAKAPAKKVTAPRESPRALWRRQMAEELRKKPASTAAPGTGWVDAAAVLPSFDSLKLKPVAGKPASHKDMLVRLAAICDMLPDGRWTLQMKPRQKSIARLWKNQELLAALKANPRQGSPAHRRIMRQIALSKRTQPLPTSPEDLPTAKEINSWFELSSRTPYDPDLLAAALERQAQIGPLRRLIRQFKGRKAELRHLEQHRTATGTASSSPILVLTGKGGVGKSALLGQYLLSLEKQAERKAPPAWVYLDFDDPQADWNQPRKLIEIAARQLSLLFSKVRKRFIALETRSSAGDALLLRLMLGAGRSVEPARKGAGQEEEGDLTNESSLLEALDEIISTQNSPPSLLLVLDTFEQVQARGSQAVAKVRAFLDLMRTELPYARFIVCGRAPVSQWTDVPTLTLGDLDPVSADAMLQQMHITPKKWRTTLISELGTSPLSLRLAAEAIERGVLSKEDIQGDMAAAGHKVQKSEALSYLYTRILGHLKDSEVQRLAHPGLVVRRITPEVIREVLSPICQLDPGHAEAIFRRLPAHVALFEPDLPGPGGEPALRHRQDVRELMLRRMPHDPKYSGQILPVHQAAAAYYRHFAHPTHRAEAIYHGLMLDLPHANLDPLWPPDLDDATTSHLALSLGRCWDEPLPEASRRWLRVRLGREGGSEKLVISGSGSGSLTLQATAFEVEHVDHYDVHRTIQQLVDQGQGERALQLIEEHWNILRPEPRLTLLKLRALMLTGNRTEANTLLRTALTSAQKWGKTPTELALLLFGIEMTKDDASAADDFRTYTQRALAISYTAHDDLTRLKVLEVTVEHSLHRNPASVPHEMESLAAHYARTPEEELRREPEVSHGILNLVTPPPVDILLKAARTFGNLSQQDVFKADPLLLEKLVQAGITMSSPPAQELPLEAPYRRRFLALHPPPFTLDVPAGKYEGQKTPSLLAYKLFEFSREVGLSTEEMRPFDLAATAIKFSRMGDLMALILQHSGSDPLVLRDAAALVNRPAFSGPSRPTLYASQPVLSNLPSSPNAHH